MSQGRGRRRLWLHRLLAVLSGLTLVVGGLELFLRWRIPFAAVTWPVEFDAQVGHRFVPGAYVEHTNLFDFACRERVNSLGFLDREHPVPAPPGRRRIVVLGDSFVEAAQVSNAQKFPALLEEMLRADGEDWEVIAFGLSGYGTANQIAFYEALARQYEPELVLLVFVSNDFANSSPILESVRFGWHPEHTPRLYFVPTADGGFRRTALDPASSTHAIHTSVPPVLPWHSAAFGWSRLYRFVEASLDRYSLAAMTQAEIDYQARVEILRKMPGMADAFGDWQPRDDLYIDWMFCARDLPPVFAEAVRMTDHSLGELARQCAADGAALRVLATQDVGYPRTHPKRALLPNGQLDRLRQICDGHRVPLLDLRGEFSRMGVLDQIEWSRDSHWNPKGHRAAAEAIHRWLRPNLTPAAGRR